MSGLTRLTRLASVVPRWNARSSSRASASRSPARAASNTASTERSAASACGQDRIGRARRQHAGLPHDLPLGHQRFEAAGVTAAARLAADRDDGRVPDLACAVLRPAVQLAADHEARAHAHPAVDEGEHVHVAARAEHRLGQRHRAHVVVHHDRAGRDLGQDVADRYVAPAQAGRQHVHAGARVGQAGRADADTRPGRPGSRARFGERGSSAMSAASASSCSGEALSGCCARR